MRAKVPIVLITGGLGSGKTTLVRRIISTTDRCMAVLINEFGEVAVDGRIAQGGRSIEIVEYSVRWPSTAGLLRGGGASRSWNWRVAAVAAL